MENAAPSGVTARGGLVSRGLRGVACWTLKAFLVLTIVSLTFNALTTPPRTTSAPAGQDVEVNGARVHYQQWGGSGSPIVLVHGFFESSVAWEAAADHLAERHRVYAVDLAGAGYSQYTGRYSLKDQTALVSGFITRLGLGRAALARGGRRRIGGAAPRRPGECRRLRGRRRASVPGPPVAGRCSRGYCARRTRHRCTAPERAGDGSTGAIPRSRPAPEPG